MVQIFIIADDEQSSYATAHVDDHRVRVNIGKSGVIAKDQKCEGDHKTPLGQYPLQHLYYRQDKYPTIMTKIPHTPITPDMGWCDDPDHVHYNKKIIKPFDASHEDLYRDDHLYDLVIQIGHNESPTIPGKGSAIFMHLKRDSETATEGCIAFDPDDLLLILKQATSESYIDISLKS